MIFKRVFYAIELFFFFLKELVKANIQVAVCVIMPNGDLRPAIVRIPLRLKSDFGITLLGNLITLTPGTLTLDVSEKRDAIFVHVIDSNHLDDTKMNIQDGFEMRIQRVFE